MADNVLRPHYHRTIRDGTGAVRLNAMVELLLPGTETAYAGSVFTSPDGNVQRGASWTSLDGLVDFYLTEVAVLDIRVTPAGGEPPKRFLSQWVGDLSDKISVPL